MRDNPKRSLLAQADTGVVRGACYLLGGLKHLALWLLGVIAIAGYFTLIFEYGDGLADISQHEWAFMLLALALTWRHCHYARHFGYGFWRGLARWLTAQGILLAAELAAMGMIIGLSLEFIGYAETLPSLATTSKEDEILALVFALLALYLGAPMRPLNADRPQPVTANARQEPSISSNPEKEASL
jgi:hypothetical protein